MIEKIDAPWNEQTIKELEAIQRNPHFHPYTCGNDSQKHRLLVPTKDGWVCLDCSYTQNWCVI